MLLPISGKRVAKAEAKKDKPASSKTRKRAWPGTSQRDE